MPCIAALLNTHLAGRSRGKHRVQQTPASSRPIGQTASSQPSNCPVVLFSAPEKADKAGGMAGRGQGASELQRG